MAVADLRARLRALVEEWREAADMQTFEAANAKRVCALDLAALLDETEEPKLKHRFVNVPGTNDYCGFVTLNGDCGQPREAHEP